MRKSNICLIEVLKEAIARNREAVLVKQNSRM